MDIVTTREDLGQRNRRMVLSEILLHGPLPRAMIAERVGLTQASVSRITRSLIDTDLIEEAEHYAGSSGRGRRFVGLQVKASGGFVVGIAINVFRQDIVIADLANQEVAQKRLKFDDLGDASGVLSRCADELLALIRENDIHPDQVLGCGVTVTGAVDAARGYLHAAPLLGWADVDVKAIVSSVLGMPVVVESIANSKNLAAHYFGPVKANDNTVLFNCSLAIGCSMFLDRRLLRGKGAGAGLIETMLAPGKGEQRYVPVDAVAGGFAVIDQQGDFQKTTNGRKNARMLKQILSLASAGDKEVKHRLFEAGQALGWVISQTCALLHPEQVLVSGPLIKSTDYCEGVQDRFAQLAPSTLATQDLIFFSISSHGAAHSLAIYEFMVNGDQKNEVLEVAEGF